MPTRLCLLLLTLLLTACQAQSTPLPPQPTPSFEATPTPRPTSAGSAQTTPTRTPSSGLGVAAANLRGVTLTFWHPLSGESAAALKTLTDDFNQNNIWGIRVNLGAFYNLTALDETINLNLREKKLPQVLLAPPEVIADWQARYQLIAPLSQFLNDAEWGLAPKEREDMSAIFQPPSDAIAIPIQRTASVLFYNLTWAQELGFRNPPTTPEEFRIQACAASRANLNDGTYENDGLGGWYINRSALTLLAWLEAFNANPLNPQTGALKFNTPQASNGLGFLRRLLDSTCAWVSPTIPPLEAFNHRQALFVSTALEDLLAQERVQKVSKNTDTWSILPYPSEHNSPSVFVSGLDGAILHGKPAEELASWLFLRWLLLPRSQAALAAAGATYPVRASALPLMADFSRLHPQWNAVPGFATQFKPAPKIPQWRIAHRVLEDAAWQIFQPYVPTTRIPGILAEIDSTLQELFQRQP